MSKTSKDRAKRAGKSREATRNVLASSTDSDNGNKSEVGRKWVLKGNEKAVIPRNSGKDSNDASRAGGA